MFRISGNLEFFTQLSGYGIIHIYSHGMAWPDDEHIQEVYVMTGEPVKDDITEELGGLAFDCECGEKFAAPKENPQIKKS